MPYLEQLGRRTYFEDSGTGPAVVLGHSFLCSTEMWRGQIGLLSEHYRVINIDYRGHGNSDPAHERFSLNDLLDDTLAILDHLEIEKAVWAGLSTGGMVALRAGIEYPQRVRALIVMDADASAERTFVAFKYRAMVAAARVVGIRPLLPFVLPLMFGRTTLRESEALVTEWKPKLAQPDLATISNWVEALVNRDDLRLRLPEIDAPVLVIVGAEDRSLPPHLSRELNRGLANSELLVVDRAGHLSALERPDVVNRAMLAFLGDLEQSS